MFQREAQPHLGRENCPPGQWRGHAWDKHFHQREGGVALTAVQQEQGEVEEEWLQPGQQTVDGELGGRGGGLGTGTPAQQGRAERKEGPAAR